MDADVKRALEKMPAWRTELQRLGQLAVESGLREEVKWNKPCYTHRGGNILILQGFKTSFAVLFFKGALLDDPQGLLEMPGEYSRHGRRARFTDAQQMTAMVPQLKAFIHRAIELEENGAKVASPDAPLPPSLELDQMFAESPGLQAAFEALTPGRQRAYLIHFARAKQSTTRRARIERSIDKIMAGKGFNE